MSFGEFALHQYKAGYRVMVAIFDFAFPALILFGVATEMIAAAVPEELMQFFRAYVNNVTLIVAAITFATTFAAFMYTLFMYVMAPPAQRRIKLASTAWTWEALPPKTPRNRR